MSNQPMPGRGRKEESGAPPDSSKTAREVVIVLGANEVREVVAAPCRKCLSRTLRLEIRPGRQELLCVKCESTTRVDIEVRDGDLVVRATLIQPAGE